MLENHLQPCITEPTRIVEDNRPSLVDNIFIKNIYEPICGNIFEKISYDHLPSFTIFESKKSTNKKKSIQTRDMKHFKEAKFQHDLNSLDLIEYPLLSTNEMTQLFHKHFMNAYNNHAPLNYLSKRASKTKQKPWLTKGILISIKIKRHLFKMYKNTHNKDYYTKYKVYRDLLNKLCRKSKKIHYTLFIQNANNIKNTWKDINQILNRKRKLEHNFQLLINNVLTQDKKKMANSFNRYFTNVANELCKRIPNTNNKFRDYLKNPNEHSIFLKETTPHEINLIIKNLRSTNTIDVYGISTKFVKLGSPALVENLTIIFNKSIQEGDFPGLFKLAKIVPIHESGTVFNVTTFRPISLLLIFSKVFERLMYDRLLSFVKKHNLLTPNQYGFQANKSTKLAVNEITNCIIQSFENKESAFGIFLDFAKAFDTVNHQILISQRKLPQLVYKLPI